MSRCANCEHYNECEHADEVCFCDECRHDYSCPVKTVCCEAGHYIECNNGFEERIEIFIDEEGVEEW